MTDEPETENAAPETEAEPAIVIPVVTRIERAAPDAEAAKPAASEPVFLGIPRHAWRQLTASAFDAEQRAKAAAAEAEDADKRLAELRDKLTADESSLADADEDAALARNAVAKARENFDRAASREERDEWRAKIPELEDKANAAATRAKEIRNRVDSTRAGIATWTGIANTKRGNAFRFRTAADNAAAKAQQVEVPEIRAALDAAERRVAAAKEAERLRALRERIPHTVCRDCRFWEPFGDDPTKGPCHAMPPSTGAGSNFSGATLSEPHIVLASNWCGKGEPLPAADKPRKAAPVLA
jgi:hypothetical protein